MSTTHPTAARLATVTLLAGLLLAARAAAFDDSDKVYPRKEGSVVDGHPFDNAVLVARCLAEFEDWSQRLDFEGKPFTATARRGLLRADSTLVNLADGEAEEAAAADADAADADASAAGTEYDCLDVLRFAPHDLLPTGPLARRRAVGAHHPVLITTASKQRMEDAESTKITWDDPIMFADDCLDPPAAPLDCSHLLADHLSARVLTPEEAETAEDCVHPRIRREDCRVPKHSHAGSAGMLAVPAFDTVVGAHVAYQGTYDVIEQSVILSSLRPGDRVLEIGANIGSYTTVMARRVGKTGRVFAIEAMRRIFDILNANVVLNGLTNVVTHNIAAAEKPGWHSVGALDMNRFANVGGSTVKAQQLHKSWSPPIVGVERMRLESIDDMYDRREFQVDGSSSIDFLKIDAEGMEMEITRACRRYLDPVGPEGVIRKRPLMLVENGDFFNGDLAFVAFLKKEFHYSCAPAENLRVHELLFCHPAERVDLPLR